MLEIQTVEDTQKDDNTPEVKLFDASGKLTLEAETAAAFLASLDWSRIIDSPAITEQASIEEGFADDNGDITESADGEPCDVEVFDGALLAECVDYDDLLESFAVYINAANAVDGKTLVEQARVSVFSDLLLAEGEYDAWLESLDAAVNGDSDLTEEQLDEKSPFKKGGFTKGVFAGANPASKGAAKQAYGMRKAMFAAMLNKGVLKRVKAGTGQGNNRKDYAYAGPKSGSTAGKTAYAREVRKISLNQTKDKQMKPASPAGRKGAVKMIYQNLGGKMPKKWVPPEVRVRMGGAGKKGKSGAAKKAQLKLQAKSKANAKAKAALGDSFELNSQANQLYEIGLAAAAIGTTLNG